MNVKHEDTVSGGALLALATAVVWMSLDMGTGAAGATLKPNFFPLICAAGIALCGAILMLRGLASEGGIPSIVDRRFAIVAFLLIVDLWWFAQIDFRFGTWLISLVAMLAFGIRRVPLLFIYPIALSAFLYLAFTGGFGVVLPTWV